ncbi:MAG TPA: condensation domain-containing protein, partial [Rugosimonospora sp.]|nr:condensation domain-containing protein [Rugosimonospora sp.]
MSSGVLTEPTTPDGAQAFRLSFPQERIWFTEQLNPGRAGLTISTALHVHGELDPAAFRAALAALVARHEALRTRFVARRTGPVQEVLPHAEVPFDVVDLRGEPAPDDLSGLLVRHLDTTFDLTAAPLLRARLLRLADGYSVLLLAIHHIICDGLSADILLRDLTALYRAARTGTPADLPELGLQYPDFAEWQRDTIDERVIAAQLDYWERELAGTSGLVDLPTDHPRAAAGDVGGALVSRMLPGSLCARLVEVARQAQASPFMLLLAAYQVVLARTSGRGDFCVGTSIGARSQHELSGVLGCFINLLALRSDTTGDLTLRELLTAVRTRCLRAYGQADVPFARGVARLAPGRSGQGRTPLFEVLLAVQDGRTGAFEVGGATLTPELVAVPAAQFDLALDVQIDAGGASLVLCYATGIFSAATAERFLDRIERVLAAFAADADQRLSAVDLATPV